jgi:hypothetical protein
MTATTTVANTVLKRTTADFDFNNNKSTTTTTADTTIAAKRTPPTTTALSVLLAAVLFILKTAEPQFEKRSANHDRRGLQWKLGLRRRRLQIFKNNINGWRTGVLLRQ